MQKGGYNDCTLKIIWLFLFISVFYLMTSIMVFKYTSRNVFIYVYSFFYFPVFIKKIFQSQFWKNIYFPNYKRLLKKQNKKIYWISPSFKSQFTIQVQQYTLCKNMYFSPESTKHSELRLIVLFPTFLPLNNKIHFFLN